MNLSHSFYRLRWNLAPFWLSRFPIHLDIELTSRCNLSCVFCPHAEKPKGFPMGDMPLGMVEAILDQGKGMAYSVKFNWRGESLLYPHFAEAVAYARKCGYVDIMLNTNGTIWNDALSELDTCFFSLDTLKPGIYAKLRPGGDFSTVVSNLIRLRNRDKDMRLGVNMRLCEENKQEVPEMERFCEEFGLRLNVKPMTWRTDFVRKPERSERKNCLMPWRRLLVDWQGNVYPCCAMWNGEYKIGNVGSASLQGIWKNGNMNFVRDGLRTGIGFDYEPCKSCFSRESYR